MSHRSYSWSAACSGRSSFARSCSAGGLAESKFVHGCKIIGVFSSLAAVGCLASSGRIESTDASGRTVEG